MPTISPQVTPYYGGGQVVNPANVLTPLVAPGTQFTEDKLGSIAVINSAATAYMLCSKSGGVDTWVQIAGAGSGTVVSVTGTAAQITAAPTTGAVVLSLPAVITAPGSLATTTTLASGTTLAAGTSMSSGTTITAGTSITATLGNITATNGNVVMSHVGNKLVIPASSSATCSAGSFTLSGAATTVVSNSAVTASSLIFLQTQVLGTVTVASTLAVTAQSPGVSFTVTPSQSTDTSVVYFLIIN